MKVLIITLHYLDANGGGSFASRAYINAFTEVADSCMLLYPDRGVSVAPHILDKCILKGIKDNRSKAKKVLDIYRGTIHRYADVVIPLLVEFNPDLVVFDNSRCSLGLIEKVKLLNKKVITIHHNYEIEYHKGTKPNVLWRMPFMYHIEKAERTALLESNLNLSITEQDSILLQKQYAKNNQVNIVCLGCFESKPNTSAIEKNIIKSSTTKSIHFVISGNLSSYQTEVSVLYFLDKIYPSILKKVANCQLTIAGRNPTKVIKKRCLKQPSINLIPNPENMHEVLQDADVYLCPVFLGGGLKLRIMDGLKAGLPIITHVVSARGYDKFKNAECLFDYRDEKTFLLSLEKLMARYDQGEFNQNAIQNLYQSFFSFESGVNRLKEILDNKL